MSTGAPQGGQAARRDGDSDMLDLLDKMGIAAWFTDKEGKVDECNETACKLLDRVKDEVIGQSLAGDLVEKSEICRNSTDE